MKKIFSQGLALAVLLGLTNCAYAAPATYNLEEMVVTATKTQLNLKELPQSAEVITKEEIKAIGATSVMDALRASTSIVVSEAAGTAPVVKMRGSSDYVLLLNGRRLTEDISRMGDDHRWERFNVQNIERIEILRGPASALYGSRAQAGVINIITKAPQEAGATVGVTSGTREMSNYYRFDTGKMGKLSASLDANFTKLRPFLWEDAGMTKMEGPKQSFNMDLRYDMDEANTLNLFLEYENADLTSRKTTGPIGNLTILPERSNYDTDRRSATLSYQGKSTKSNYTMDATFSNLRTGTERDFYDFTMRNSVRATDSFTLTYGGEFSRDEGTVEVKKQIKDTSTDQWASFVYGEYKLGDKLLLMPSVRYDHHDSFGGHTSPNFGVTYFVDANSRIKASYGSAYRAPTTDEMYRETSMITANPDLKPEKTKGFEIAYEREFDDRTSSKLAYYENKKEDAIFLDYGNYVIGKGKAQTINVEEAEYKGVEFSLDHDLGKGFSAGFAYEYLDAQRTKAGTGMSALWGGTEELGRLPYTARNTYTLKLQWTEPEEQEWSVTIWNKWLSDYWTTHNYNTVDKEGNPDTASKRLNRSINTLNLVVNKTWEDNKYSAFFGLDNVFDKELTDMRYSGRVWRVGAEVRF